MFRLAHLTDPHVGPLPRPQLRQLLSKRLTGWYNWHRSRAGAHDMELLGALVADIRAQAPNHIACTGDTCNIGLPSEWATSRIFLESLGSPQFVSFVPGNHDAYVMGALEGLLREVAPWTRGDDGREGVFPFLRRYGPVALVGLSSAIPTLPFVASGRVGSKQMKAAEQVLGKLGEDPSCFRIVLIHHPPHRGGASPGRNLTDAAAFEAMIGRVGAELVLHGHNHVGSLAHLPSPRGPVPVIGAPSASARSGTLTHKAGYHLFTIDRDETGFLLTAELRGLKPDGSIGGMGMLSLGQIRQPGRVR
ncbi:metallophosphoesterase [Microvirga sp. 17 mud 1-3]|uniref:metallophosphoesterase family protein n=1 Tax=Microvirga sp. 17 mud 1-3 TaxID=2082949 RepID=UPI000D6C055D|nr:metallophosphoesterase [Microvirga sp. 17 mud 1-3]AWM86156.1 metallophosphatase [Microvirga sp. 17 mud 1-3]